MKLPGLPGKPEAYVGSMGLCSADSGRWYARRPWLLPDGRWLTVASDGWGLYAQDGVPPGSDPPPALTDDAGPHPGDGRRQREDVERLMEAGPVAIRTTLAALRVAVGWDAAVLELGLGVFLDPARLGAVLDLAAPPRPPEADPPDHDVAVTFHPGWAARTVLRGTWWTAAIANLTPNVDGSAVRRLPGTIPVDDMARAGVLLPLEPRDRQLRREGT